MNATGCGRPTRRGNVCCSRLRPSPMPRVRALPETLEGIVAADLRAAAQEADLPGHRRCRSILRSKQLLVAARPETR